MIQLSATQKSPLVGLAALTKMSSKTVSPEPPAGLSLGFCQHTSQGSPCDSYLGEACHCLALPTVPSLSYDLWTCTHTEVRWKRKETAHATHHRKGGKKREKQKGTRVPHLSPWFLPPRKHNILFHKEGFTAPRNRITMEQLTSLKMFFCH